MKMLVTILRKSFSMSSRRENVFSHGRIPVKISWDASSFSLLKSSSFKRHWLPSQDFSLSHHGDISTVSANDLSLPPPPDHILIHKMNKTFINTRVQTAPKIMSKHRSQHNYWPKSLTIMENIFFCNRGFSSDAVKGGHDHVATPVIQDYSQRAVTVALWCNFIIFSLKCSMWVMSSSHVLLAEAVHSLADLANQALLAYGLISSRRAPDDMHPYGYSKERFVWSLISAVGIFCLGSGATIVDGFSNLWKAELPDNIHIAFMVLGGSMIMEGISLLVALSAVRKGATAEGMTMWGYCWHGHDPTAVAVLMEDGAAVTGLMIAGISLTTVSITGNPIYDPIGSIFVGTLLGVVAVFLIQRNRHALLGRAMDRQDMKRVLDFLASDPVVDAVYDCKSEVIGPRSYRFKAEIDFNGVVIVKNYLKQNHREEWVNQFKAAVNDPDERALDNVMSFYGEEVVSALGSEVDRLEREIQRLVPGIRHVDIETHNPNGPLSS